MLRQRQDEKRRTNVLRWSLAWDMRVKMRPKRMKKNIEMGILVLYWNLRFLLILTPNVLLPCQGEQRSFFSLTCLLSCAHTSCTRLHLTDIRRSGERGALTGSDKRRGQPERGRVTASSLQDNAWMTLNAFRRFSAATPQAISCLWHMRLCGTFGWRCESAVTFPSKCLSLVTLQLRDSAPQLLLSARDSCSTRSLQNPTGNQLV